jgi:hypothetical protein
VVDELLLGRSGDLERKGQWADVGELRSRLGGGVAYAGPRGKAEVRDDVGAGAEVVSIKEGCGWVPTRIGKRWDF